MSICGSKLVEEAGQNIMVGKVIKTEEKKGIAGKIETSCIRSSREVLVIENILVVENSKPYVFEITFSITWFSKSNSR